MGLDIVELFMRVEEEFGIAVQDAEAEGIATPRELCALIESKLVAQNRLTPAYCSTSRAFYRIRRALTQMGVQRPRITPQTSFNYLWSASSHQQNWRVLSTALGYPLPRTSSSLHRVLSNVFEVAPRPQLDSIGDLARFLAPYYQGYAPSNLWNKLRDIIADEIGMPLPKITLDSHFVYDLGMG